MDVLFQSRVEWPPQSALTIETSDGNQMTLQIPILKFRWPLFAQNQEAALEIARKLTQEQLKSILLYTYSDLPAKRAMSEVFNLCQLSHPQSLQQSTFVEDMRKLMHDTESADFQLIAAEPNGIVPVHRAILAARSKYFRALFLSGSNETISNKWSCTRPIPKATLEFFVEYVYTGQISSPQTMDLLPLIWLVRYLRLSGEKEVENIIISSLSRDLNEHTHQAIFEAAKEWDAKCVMDVIDKYNATRR